MKLIILMAFIGYAAGLVYQQPLIRVESKKTKMMKDGTWDAYFKDKQLLQQSLTDDDLNLTDFDEVEYIANITIGTPGQVIKIHFDVASSRFWIPDATCEINATNTPYCPWFCHQPGGSAFCNPECNRLQFVSAASDSPAKVCNQKSKYDSTKSSTYVVRDEINSNYSLDFEFGYVSVLDKGQENVQIGPYSLQKTYFLQATEISPVFADTPFDGILGIYDMDFYLKPLANQLENSIYTVFFQDTKNEYNVPGGYITFGAEDDVHCNSDVNYESTLKPYTFAAFDVSYGTSTSIVSYADISLTTSRTTLIGPAAAIKQIKEAAGANLDGTIPCDAKIEDITFRTLNDYNQYKYFTIPAKNLIIHNISGSCSLALETMPPLTNEFHWIFGTPWFRSYCTTFGSSKSEGTKIGFATVIV